MNLSDHPGYMGWIDGVIAHHSNWPAYPFEGAEGLMFRLAAFAPKTRFVVIEDNDRAVLFVADVDGTKLQKPMLELNFHVAGWHEDLLKLHRDGMISGVKPVSEDRWKVIQWKSLPRALFEANGIDPDNEDEVLSKPLYFTIDGEKFPSYPPKKKDDPADEEPLLSWPEFPENKIVVTPAGRDRTHELLVKDWGEWRKHSSPKAIKLFELGFHDTCVREACVELEWTLKKSLGSRAYGDKLVEAYVEDLASRKCYLESSRRTIRQDLRAVFKLIRNRFMHVLADIDQTSALVNLIRIARIRSIVVTGDQSND
jgi:hypothetical protein